MQADALNILARKTKIGPRCYSVRFQSWHVVMPACHPEHCAGDVASSLVSRVPSGKISLHVRTPRFTSTQYAAMPAHPLAVRCGLCQTFLDYHKFLIGLCTDIRSRCLHYLCVPHRPSEKAITAHQFAYQVPILKRPLRAISFEVHRM